MTAQSILAALETGARPRSEVLAIPGAEYALRPLIRQHKLMELWRDGVSYLAPFKRPTDDPLPPKKIGRPRIRPLEHERDWKPKRCKCCRKMRKDYQFGYHRKGGPRKEICYRCVYLNKKARMENNKRGSSIAGCHAIPVENPSGS